MADGRRIAGLLEKSKRALSQSRRAIKIGRSDLALENINLAELATQAAFSLALGNEEAMDGLLSNLRRRNSRKCGAL